MGFLRRLFGKKQKEEVKVKEEVKEAPAPKPVVEPEPEPIEEAPVPEPTPEPEPEEEPALEPEPDPKPEPKQENPDEDEPVYEVKMHKEGGWQVIKKGATRAKRRLETQAKAMEYCRENNLKYEVYKMDGTLK